MTELNGFELLRIEADSKIAIITLNRPEVLSACNPAINREVQRAIAAFEFNWGDVIILRGPGHAFYSGSDLREIGKIQGTAIER